MMEEQGLKIAILEPFLGGSHRRWAEGLQKHSRHEIRIFGLPGRHWKWRMHGGAVSLSRQYLDSGFQADLLLASDMLDLGAFLSLTRQRTHKLPVALYFHENQLTYPWSPADQDIPLKRDNHYSYINYLSALSADALLFNSDYHRSSFLQALPAFLRMFPDHREEDLVQQLASKSQTLYLGMDLQALQTFKPTKKTPNPSPLILWNHRWEYDKAPEVFFQALLQLAEEGADFQLVVLGESYGKQPPIFAKAQTALQDRILHWGHAPKEQYVRWLWQADLLPVTSIQDFFGGSVVEAIYCGCYPLLPQRLAYPEHIPKEWQKEVLYAEESEFLPRLRSLLTKLPPHDDLSRFVQRYDWRKLAPVYDRIFAHLAKNKAGNSRLIL